MLEFMQDSFHLKHTVGIIQCRQNRAVLLPLLLSCWVWNKTPLRNVKEQILNFQKMVN